MPKRTFSRYQNRATPPKKKQEKKTTLNITSTQLEKQAFKTIEDLLGNDNFETDPAHRAIRNKRDSDRSYQQALALSQQPKPMQQTKQRTIVPAANFYQVLQDHSLSDKDNMSDDESHEVENIGSKKTDLDNEDNTLSPSQASPIIPPSPHSSSTEYATTPTTVPAAAAAVARTLWPEDDELASFILPDLPNPSSNPHIPPPAVKHTETTRITETHPTNNKDIDTSTNSTATSNQTTPPRSNTDRTITNNTHLPAPQGRIGNSRNHLERHLNHGGRQGRGGRGFLAIQQNKVIFNPTINPYAKKPPSQSNPMQTQTEPPPVSNNPTPNSPLAASGNRLIPARPYMIRYDLRVNLQPSDNADTTLLTTLKDIFQRIYSEDPTLIVYPWSDTNLHLPNITNSSRIPQTINSLRQYFNRAVPKRDGGMMYVNVRLGTTLPFSTIMEGISWWLKDEEHGLYKCALQAETTTTLGWLLYSLREMDLVTLKDAIEKLLPNAEIGLRWRVISLGKSGPIPADQRVRAIHVEIDSTQVETIKPLIYQIYSSEATNNFPNGIKMRMVPELTPLTGTAIRSKVERLRIRQAAFEKNILRAQSWEFTAIDYVDPAMKASLRDLMMNIKDRNKPHLNLFHSVDATWSKDGYVVTFLPELNNDAREVLAGLHTYLRHYHPAHAANISKFFTPSVVERTATDTWDDTDFTVITATDHLVNSLIDNDPEFNFADPTSANPPTNPMVSPTLVLPDPQRPTTIGHPGDIFYGGDEDTVATFRTTAPDPPPPPRCAIQPTTNKNVDNQDPNLSSTRSVMDNSSVTTASVLEQKVGQLENSVNFIAQQIALLTASSNSTGQQTPHDSTQTSTLHSLDRQPDVLQRLAGNPDDTTRATGPGL